MGLEPTIFESSALLAFFKKKFISWSLLNGWVQLRDNGELNKHKKKAQYSEVYKKSGCLRAFKTPGLVARLGLQLGECSHYRASRLTNVANANTAKSLIPGSLLWGCLIPH